MAKVLFEGEWIKKKIFILIIYDITDNRRRIAFAKKMKSYGFRVQKSAFEAYVSSKLYKQILEEIPILIDEEEDSVRLYRIPDNQNITLYGNNVEIPSEEYIIL